MITIVLAALGLLLAVVAAILVWQVDDWSRDLTQNFAQTSDDAEDRELRPLETTLSVPAAADLVVQAAARLPGWSSPERVDDEPGSTVLKFVRTTRLVRYRDDVTVRVTPSRGGARIDAESHSRVGKGDLGQNPRNLKELLAAVRARLP